MARLLQEYECLAIALSERDAYTGSHCDRVVELAQGIGRRCDLDDTELWQLRIASKFHDIGKIGVPDAVLLKAGALSADERITIQSHAALGQRICMAVPRETMVAVGLIVRHHHEGFDGSGYPDHLAGEKIPPLARILSIADSYDAIATARPYHRSRNHDEVMAMMRDECGGKFDPYLFSKFTALIAHSEYRALEPA